MRRNRLLPLCLLLPIAPLACNDSDPGTNAGDAPVAATSREQDPTQSRLVRGERAIKLLDDNRRKLLDILQEASDIPIEIVLDEKTLSVVSVTGHIVTRGDSLKERANDFVTVFADLLNPIVPSREYVVAPTDPACYASTVVFDRFVEELPVVGSRLTLHFDASHAIESVTNGIAPVPSQFVEADPTSIDGARPISEVVPRDQEGPLVRTKVLVPAPDHSGVVPAEMVTWGSAEVKGPVKPGAVIAIGDIAITDRLAVVTPIMPKPPSSRRGPHYLDKDGLPLPEFISYRGIGGVNVTHFPWEHNPIETAYRFLEEHPALMRSFAARCQFSPRDVAEDPAAPGVYFVRLQQKYGPLPVFGSELVVMQEGLGKVMSVAGRTLPKIEAAESPSITPADAVAAADRTLLDGISQEPQYTDAVRAALSRPAKLVLGVLPAHKQDLRVGQSERLSFEVARGPYVFYVDALTGSPIGSRALITAANVVTDALGGSEWGWPFVRDEVDGIPTGLVSPRSFDNMPGRPGGTAGASVAAVASFYGGLGWTGSNGRGADWVANTNVGMTFTPCQNAFFDGILTGQTFYCPGAAANDVVGHEFTHGVVAASSRLWFSDQSGALNEAYADIMGNLIFPDATPGWLVGELTTGGTFRDMANPTGFNGDPMHMSGFLSRDATCNLLPWSCDSGFVHANAGIVNRAHVLLTDGIPGPGGGMLTPGIGRLKMRQLVHTTMTRRLHADSRLHDAAVATRDICDMFVARGTIVTDATGTSTPFTVADCDQVTAAFNQVGLNGHLDTGWQEPTLGFAGTRTFYASGETTPGGCPVSNVVADLATISGNRSADLSPATALPTSASYFFGAQSISLRVSPTPVPMPLGTTAMFHIVDWTNIWGHEPRYATRVDFPATCAPPVTQVTRVSATFTSPDNLFGAGGTNFIGTTASSWGPGCTLRDTTVELVDGGGNTMAGPSRSVLSRVTHFVFGIAVNFDMRATIATPAPGGPGGNLVAAVTWGYDMGRGPARIRLRYTIDQAAGSVCAP